MLPQTVETAKRAPHFKRTFQPDQMLLLRRSARCSLSYSRPSISAFRSLSSSSPRLDPSTAHQVQASSSRELHEVDRLDALLSNIREHSGASKEALINVRTPSLWSETLHRRTTTTEAKADSDAKTSSGALPPRRMHDSYSQLDLPFASNPSFLDQYTNAQGGIRTGKMMEHLDFLAGSISYKHCVSLAAIAC